jgi:hypothetical protein
MNTSQNKLNDPRRPIPAPVQYAGQWVAWNPERTQVIAHGPDVTAVRAAAIAAGQPDALLQKVARPDQVFVGTL